MSEKFKIGDRVIRFQGGRNEGGRNAGEYVADSRYLVMHEGDEDEVRGINDRNLTLKNYGSGHDVCNYKLAQKEWD